MTKQIIDEEVALRFISGYRKLKASLANFDDHLRQFSICDVRYSSIVPTDPLPLVTEAYTSVIFSERGRLTGVSQLFGVVGVKRETIEYALHINSLKDEVALAVEALRESVGWQSRGAGQLFKRDPVMGEFLRAEGLARLNLASVYRHFPVASHRVSKVYFSWTTRSRKIRKMTPLQALSFLRERAASEEACTLFERYIETCSAKYVAYATKISPSIVANLWSRLPGDRIGKELIRTPLPILYPYAEEGPMPVSWPDPVDSVADRKRRSDVIIGAEPIVPGIPIYPYCVSALTETGYRCT